MEEEGRQGGEAPLTGLLRELTWLSFGIATLSSGVLGAGVPDSAPEWGVQALWYVLAGSVFVWLVAGVWWWALLAPPGPPPGASSDPAPPGGALPLGRAARLRRRLAALFPQRDGKPRVALTLARYVLAPAAVFVLLGALLSSPFDDSCAPPTEIVVATTPDSEPAVEAVAAAFAEERAADGGSGERCRSVRVTVYAVDDGQRMRNALLGTWDSRLGPLPHVWIPDSTVEALMVRDALAARAADGAPTAADDLGGGSAAGAAGSAGSPAATAPPDGGAPLTQVTAIDVGEATRLTPLVLAVPRDLAAEVTGDDPDAVVLDDPYAALREAVGPAGVRVARADPGDSAAAMLHTAFLYAANGAIAPGGDLLDADRAAEIEHELSLGLTAHTERDLVCQVAQHAHDTVPVAALTTEAAVYEAAEGPAWRAACPGPTDSGAELTALYSSELPVLDHPFVRVTGVRAGADADAARPVVEAPEVAAELRRFERYLDGFMTEYPPAAFDRPYREAGASPSAAGAYAGYRNEAGAGRVTMGVGSAPAQLPNPEGDPEAWRDAAGAVLDLYDSSQGSAALLLAVDRSSSMGTPNRKFATALEEAAVLAQSAGPRDALGLWAFPQGRGPSAADATALVDPQVRTGGLIVRELAALAPDREATPLREVVAEGAEALAAWADARPEEDPPEGADAGGEQGAAAAEPVLVVFTDGVGEPAGGGLSADATADRLDAAGVRVRLVAVGDETRRWGRVDPCDVAGLPELAEHPLVDCVPADADSPGEAALRVLGEARAQ
ncbi:hypothetical protein HNR12_001525 [Streptomonospora nanhaiensis]|uniref:VWFA domain-containing protein n=1 Tax=Streptomonospora nanhaiensis TaxID=1323731 RepID=A0A853BIB9_9ACTN|nr:vWA domain-containing protein [Streptomonospora nanhaiensis]NYI95248.1 hypothetical protein [Streptomonospora nanhaiensis]